MAAAVLAACFHAIARVVVVAIVIPGAGTRRNIGRATTLGIVTTVGTASTSVVTYPRIAAARAIVATVVDRTWPPVVTHHAVLGKHRLAHANSRVAHVRDRADTGRRACLRAAGGAETAAAPIIGRASITIVTDTVIGQDPRRTFTRRGVACAFRARTVEVRTIDRLPGDTTRCRVAGFETIAGVAVVAGARRSDACSRTARVGHGAGVAVVTRVAFGTARLLGVRIDAAIGFRTHLVANIVAYRHVGAELGHDVGPGIRCDGVGPFDDCVFTGRRSIVTSGSEYQQQQRKTGRTNVAGHRHAASIANFGPNHTLHRHRASCKKGHVRAAGVFTHGDAANAKPDSG